ncbi:NADP-dependent oxidoreductase domain-containing protein [Pavlovales sp. CCMP2436]|nr:NADP-dependent oxidoreductase domain-containing protein [Pavlovales sp. CCMP2436]
MNSNRAGKTSRYFKSAIGSRAVKPAEPPRPSAVPQRRRPPASLRPTSAAMMLLAYIMLLALVVVAAAPSPRLDLGRMGVGTWAWGNKLLWGYDTGQDAELQAAFGRAVDRGVKFFDTGDSYGTGALEGRAESLLGQFRGELPAQKSENICFGTKLAVYPWRLTPRSFVDACRASLGRMERTQLEVVQAHWSAQRFQPWQEQALWEGLADCYDLGLAKAVGLSNFGPRQLEKCAAYMARREVCV